MPETFTAIHHVAMTTKHLDRAVAFYQRHFGAEILRHFDWQASNQAFSTGMGLDESEGRIVMLGLGDMRIEFFEFAAPAETDRNDLRRVSEPGLTHLAFVTEDCHAAYAQMLADGVPFHAPPLKMPAGGIFAYGRDPDGNIIEILQLPPA